MSHGCVTLTYFLVVTVTVAEVKGCISQVVLCIVVT